MSIELFASETFDLDNVEHEAVEKYHPLYFAHGGEHVVYEVEGHPNVVVKVDARKMKQMMQANLEAGKPIDYFDEDYKERILENIGNTKERLDLMKYYFGNNHIPATRRFILKVPITKQIMEFIFKDQDIPECPSEISALVTVQQKVHEAVEPTSKWLVAGYSEWNAKDIDSYSRLTNALVFDTHSVHNFDILDFLTIHGVKWTRDLINALRKDEKLRQTVTDLISNCIQYTNDTGNILDLAARNIAIIKKDDGYDYQLIDALYPSDSPIISETETALNDFSHGIQLDRYDLGNILNSLNYIRLINGIASFLKMPQRITALQGTAVDCAKLYTPLSEYRKNS